MYWTRKIQPPDPFGLSVKMRIFKARSQNSEPRNRAKTRSRAALDPRNCFTMWSVFVSDHKKAFGMEIAWFWQFPKILILGVLRLNSEPRNRAKHRSRAGTRFSELLQNIAGVHE